MERRIRIFPEIKTASAWIYNKGEKTEYSLLYDCRMLGIKVRNVAQQECSSETRGRAPNQPPLRLPPAAARWLWSEHYFFRC